MNLSNVTRVEKEEIFTSLISPLKSKLYKTGMAILKNDDDCADAIQETLISCYNNLEKLENVEYFSTWIIRIMINKCYDIIRKNQKQSDIHEKIEISHDKDFYYDHYQSDSVVQKALNCVDDDSRLLVILYYYDGFSIKEISKINNMPEGTVKSKIARAREKIHLLLVKEGEVNE